MRHITLLFTFTLLVSSISVAQDDHAHDAAANSNATLRSYVVQLTEVRLPSFSEPRLTPDELVRSINQMDSGEKGEVVEIVRLSALEGHDSMVQFGKVATVTIGTTSTGGPGRTQARQTQQQAVGTIVRLTAIPRGDMVLLTLSYEASRFAGGESDDRQPDTTTTQVNTTLLVKPGEPKLVGGTSADGSSLLLVTVTQ